MAKECCSPFPCPYHGKNGKTCEECGCFQESYWDDDEDKIQTESDDNV